MKTKFGLAALDAIQKNYKIILDRLIKGYEKVTGKQPEGIDLTMIKREAYEKAEDSAKVVDMEGKTLDPSKPIMGGRQDFGENIREIYDEAKGPGKGDEMVEALKSPGARKSTEIIEKQIQETFPDIKLFGDETFEEILEIQRTGKHPRMKADGGLLGEVKNLIGAGLEKGSDFASGAGRFILGAASGIPGIGLGISALQNLNQNTFSNLPIGDQLFITEQMGIQGLDNQSGLAKDKYGYNIRSAFGNYADLVSRRADIARQRELAGQRQRAIDEYYLNLEKERQAAEAEAQRRAATATSQMAAANRAAGTGGYQSDFAQDSGFMGGSGTAAEMGSFADGGIATMFVEKR